MKMNLAQFNLMKNVEEKAIGTITAMAQDMDDISTAQDEQTKAIVSIYKALELIADKLEIELPAPLVDMTIENPEENANESSTTPKTTKQ